MARASRPPAWIRFHLFCLGSGSSTDSGFTAGIVDAVDLAAVVLEETCVELMGDQEDGRFRGTEHHPIRRIHQDSNRASAIWTSRLP